MTVPPDSIPSQETAGQDRPYSTMTKRSPKQRRELWGPIGQIGYVVNNLDEATAKWTDTIGVGPWTTFRSAPIEGLTYRGEPTDAEVSIALAYFGDMQIELIQQHNDAPSLYRDVLDTYGEGVQHICCYPTDYDAALDAAVDAGMTPAQSGSIWGIHFTYLLGDAGRVIEFASLPPAVVARRATNIEAAAAWDG